MPPFESKELPVPVAAKLNILVHPLFITQKGVYFTDNPQAREAEFREERRRRHFFFNVLTHFSPQAADEYTLFMPLIKDGQDPYDPAVMEEYMNKDYRVEQWPELYQALRHRSKQPDNVILIPNSTGSGADSGEEIIAPLRKKGIAVTDKTEVVIGGEWLDVCMAHITDQMLNIPYVKGIAINLDATTNTGSYLDRDETQVEMEYIESLVRRSFTVDVSDRIVTVRKIW